VESIVTLGLVSRTWDSKLNLSDEAGLDPPLHSPIMATTSQRVTSSMQMNLNLTGTSEFGDLLTVEPPEPSACTVRGCSHPRIHFFNMEKGPG